MFVDGLSTSIAAMLFLSNTERLYTIVVKSVADSRTRFRAARLLSALRLAVISASNPVRGSFVIGDA